MQLYYQRVGLLASEALRPFDARHDGSLFGEGAAALVLETEASAAARGAAVLGEVMGGGSVCEAEGLLGIRDDGDGVARAIELALADAGIAAADVGMIVAHGNGTRLSDCSEAAAFRRVFGSTVPPVTAFKWAFGHLIAAAGTLDAVLALEALRRGVVPGLATLERARPRLRAAAGGARHGARAQQYRAGRQSRVRGGRCRAGRSRGLNPAPAAMTPTAAGSRRCGIDNVDIARIERLIDETPAGDLARLFSAQELADAGEGPGRAASLAARFAAKEACLKLFPRETALGSLEAADFSVVRDNYGAPRLAFGGAARKALDRHRIADIALSLTHDRNTASAMAVPEPATTAPSLAGRLIYRFAPLRRDVIVANLERVYGEDVDAPGIAALAQAHYGHLWRLLGEFLKFRWLSPAAKRALVRVENIDAYVAAQSHGKGILVLTGHFGNWEVATIAGIGNYPEVKGRFHFVRRAVKPAWLDRIVTRRFNRAGFGVFPKRGSLDAMLDKLAQGDAIVFPFDQHARPPDGIESEFLGHPAWTFRSLAIIALATGAPVLPATSWREPDGRHVLRFEDALMPVEHENTGEAIRINTRRYNAKLEEFVLRRPEQWYWVHRRWKTVVRGKR